MRPKNNPKENKPLKPGSYSRWSVKTELAPPALKSRPLFRIHNLPEEGAQREAEILMVIYANSTMKEKMINRDSPDAN